MQGNTHCDTTGAGAGAGAAAGVVVELGVLAGWACIKEDCKINKKNSKT